MCLLLQGIDRYDNDYEKSGDADAEVQQAVLEVFGGNEAEAVRVTDAAVQWCTEAGICGAAVRRLLLHFVRCGRYTAYRQFEAGPQRNWRLYDRLLAAYHAQQQQLGLGQSSNSQQLFHRYLAAYHAWQQPLGLGRSSSWQQFYRQYEAAYLAVYNAERKRQEEDEGLEIADPCPLKVPVSGWQFAPACFADLLVGAGIMDEYESTSAADPSTG